MQLVDTIKGPIERDQLEVKDIITEGENYRAIATEWYFEGELVKRDCHVVVLHGQALGAAQAAI
jgi:hypothetical protein